MYCVIITWCFRKEKEATSTLGHSLSKDKGLQVHGSCMCPDTDTKGAKPRPREVSDGNKGTHRVATQFSRTAQTKASKAGLAILFPVTATGSC